PHSTDPDLWFALTVARFVNWPATLAELGYPVPWNPQHFLQVLSDRKRRNEKVFTSAYMIHASKQGCKAVHLATDVLTPLWEARQSLRSIVHGSLADAHQRLTQHYGFGSFMAGQVIADLKYVQPLRAAPDWSTWACPGPGSKRGLNRVLGRPVNAPWSDPEWF